MEIQLASKKPRRCPFFSHTFVDIFYAIQVPFLADYPRDFVIAALLWFAIGFALSSGLWWIFLPGGLLRFYYFIRNRACAEDSIEEQTKSVPEQLTNPPPPYQTKPIPEQLTNPLPLCQTKPVREQLTNPPPPYQTKPVPEQLTNPPLCQTKPAPDQVTKPQIARGFINCKPINALLDTGSDVMVISRHQADLLGLDVQTAKKHKTYLQLATGFRIVTDGIVLGAKWNFDVSESVARPIECNIHVVSGLSCDFIMGKEFIFKYKVFRNYKQCIFEVETVDELSADTAQFFIIKDCGKSTRKHRWSRFFFWWRKPSNSTQSPNQNPANVSQSQLDAEELHRRAEAADRNP